MQGATAAVPVNPKNGVLDGRSDVPVHALRESTSVLLSKRLHQAQTLLSLQLVQVVDLEMNSTRLVNPDKNAVQLSPVSRPNLTVRVIPLRNRSGVLEMRDSDGVTLPLKVPLILPVRNRTRSQN